MARRGAGSMRIPDLTRSEAPHSHDRHDDLDSLQPHEALLHAAVEANVRHTVQALLGTWEVQARLARADR